MRNAGHTPCGAQLVPEDAYDWAMQDGILTSPTCAVERAVACVKSKFDRELAGEKATMETKYSKRLENLEKKMEMTGIRDLERGSTVGDVKLAVNQIKAKLKGETVPTVLATLFMAVCAFGGITVQKENINDLGDADVVTGVEYVFDGVTPGGATNIASATVSNLVTKSFVEGLGIDAGHTDEEVKGLAGGVVSNTVTKSYVEGLGVEADVPEYRVRTAVSNVVTKSFVDGLGLDTVVTRTTVTNVSAHVASNVVTKTYVEGLGIEAGHTDGEVKELAGEVVTNAAPGLVSNVVTKTYVEGLGVVASVDTQSVDRLVGDLTAEIPRVQINNMLDSGLKLASVAYNGEERDIYMPAEMPAESDLGTEAAAAKRRGGESSFRIRTSGSGSQTYMFPYGSAFFWAKTLDFLWVGGDVTDDGTVYGASRLPAEIARIVKEQAPPPGDYYNVSNKAMTAIQSLQPAYDYTDASAETIAGQVLHSVTDEFATVVSEGVLSTVTNELVGTIVDQVTGAVTNEVLDVVTNQSAGAAMRLKGETEAGSFTVEADREVTETRVKDTVLGIVTAVNAVDGEPIPEFTLYPVSGSSYVIQMSAANQPFNTHPGVHADIMAWTSAYHTVFYSGYKFVQRYFMFLYRERFYAYGTGAITTDRTTCKVGLTGSRFGGTTDSYAFHDEYSVSGLDVRTITARHPNVNDAFIGYPSQTYTNVVITRGTDPVYYPQHSIGKLALEGFSSARASYVGSSNGVVSADAMFRYTNIVDSTHMQWDVYVLGEKLPGRMVPDMDGRPDAGAWYWKYEGGNGTAVENNIGGLAYGPVGDFGVTQYRLTCTNGSGSASAGWLGHYDSGFLDALSPPSSGLQIVPFHNYDPDGVGTLLSLSPTSYGAYSFVCVDEPYVYRKKISEIATVADVAEHKVTHLTKGDRITDADLNIYSVTNLGEDLIIYKDKTYSVLDEPVSFVPAPDSSATWLTYKYTNPVDASYFVRLANEDTAAWYGGWFFVPMGTDELPDDYKRAVSVQSTREDTGKYYDALTLGVPTPYIITWPGGAATSIHTVVANRYIPMTNFVTRPLFESSVFPVACTNTSNSSMGVVRPSYDGSSVIWTWSEN